MKRKALSARLLFLSPVLIGFLFFLVISYLYYRRTADFLFFDEYANIIAGYFITQGRTLYSENFFNHQMLPAYLSYLVQVIMKPQTLYQLISYHRLIVIAMSFVSGLFLVFRMRWIGLGVVVLFELVKYYYFGNLFLAESLIVYPLVYLFFLAWTNLMKQPHKMLDYAISAGAAWFIIFSREPYVPLALFLYLVFLFGKPITWSNARGRSLLLFCVLCLLTLTLVPIREYFYEVGYVNFVTVFHDQLSRNAGAGLGLSAMVLYPLLVFFRGEQSFLRNILMLVSAAFLVSLGFTLLRQRSFKLLFFILVSFTLANVRLILPGVQFYSAFYQMQWFVLMLTTVLLLIAAISTRMRKTGIILVAVLFFGYLGIILLQRDYFLRQQPQQQTLFTYNYDKFYITGQAMKVMARPDSTMFVDFSDSLMYWTAGLKPAISTGVYYPVMHDIPAYRQLRSQMFTSAPPDFYYTNCHEGLKYFYALPKTVSESYAPVRFEGNPSCLFVKKSITSHLTTAQVSALESLRFSLAPEFLAQPAEKLLQ